MDTTIKEAREHLNLLIRNPSKFRMCVPVQKTDSDEIFCRAFEYAEELEVENEKLLKSQCDMHLEDDKGFCAKCDSFVKLEKENKKLQERVKMLNKYNNDLADTIDNCDGNCSYLEEGEV